MHKSHKTGHDFFCLLDKSVVANVLVWADHILTVNMSTQNCAGVGVFPTPEASIHTVLKSNFHPDYDYGQVSSFELVHTVEFSFWFYDN